jgi:hypothetical protein
MKSVAALIMLAVLVGATSHVSANAPDPWTLRTASVGQPRAHAPISLAQQFERYLQYLDTKLWRSIQVAQITVGDVAVATSSVSDDETQGHQAMLIEYARAEKHARVRYMWCKYHLIKLLQDVKADEALSNPRSPVRQSCSAADQAISRLEQTAKAVDAWRLHIKQETVLHAGR